MDETGIAGRIRIYRVEVLSDDWYTLKKTTFEYLRGEGTWQMQSRETYDRGNGAPILLYNVARGTVILTRQFRFPAFVDGHPGMLVEACSDLLDADDAEQCSKKEAEEKAGYRVPSPPGQSEHASSDRFRGAGWRRSDRGARRARAKAGCPTSSPGRHARMPACGRTGRH